jgi:hypothetical protein
MANAAGVVSLEAVRQAQREAGREAPEAPPEAGDLTEEEIEALDLLAHCGAFEDGLQGMAWTVNGERRVVLCGVCEDEEGEECIEPIAVLLTGDEELVPPDDIEARD